MVGCFNIIDWCFWTPSVSGKKDALSELENNICNNSPNSPNLPYIPTLAKRRFSQLTKMVVEVGYSLIKKNEQIPIFFISKYGEISKKCVMAKQVIKTSESSPSLFSYSTYNAAVAQLNILLKNNKRAVAISALENQLEIALVQIISFLKYSDEDKVLLLIAEEAIPEEYKSVCFDRSTVYCFGILISIKDGNIKLSIEDDAKSQSSNKVLDFFKFLSSDNKSLDLDRVRLIKDV